MAIKEKDLQTVNSIEGGKLRCVTANGESRNINADAVSGVVAIIQANINGPSDEHDYILDKTYLQIRDIMASGKIPFVIMHDTNIGETYILPVCMTREDNGSYMLHLDPGSDVKLIATDENSTNFSLRW